MRNSPTQDLPSDDRAFSSPSQAQKKLPSVFSQTSVHPPLSTVHSLISTQKYAELFHTSRVINNHGIVMLHLNAQDLRERNISLFPFHHRNL